VSKLSKTVKKYYSIRSVVECLKELDLRKFKSCNLDSAGLMITAKSAIGISTDIVGLIASLDSVLGFIFSHKVSQEFFLKQLIVLIIQQVIVALESITNKVVNRLAILKGVVTAFEGDEVVNGLLL
jgi:hypothetical protein